MVSLVKPFNAVHSSLLTVFTFVYMCQAPRTQAMQPHKQKERPKAKSLESEQQRVPRPLRGSRSTKRQVRFAGLPFAGGARCYRKGFVHAIAIFAADAALKTSAQDYADQVKLAMLQNPFDLGNDTLFEDWKTVARLAQAVTQIEAEFRKIYDAASDLSTGSAAGFATMPTLASPQGVASGELEVVKEIQATDHNNAANASTMLNALNRKCTSMTVT